MMTPFLLNRQPPTLGDLRTSELVRLAAEWWRTGERPLRCRLRGLTLDDIRAELRLREVPGKGVGR
ncbi:MAG: hypothetical protein M3Q10_18470 [Chloroflexota bacterium]|nr:hypothetical protein [Chloroflexota bacterium]